MIRLAPISLNDQSTAIEVHRIRRAAYSQEAAILGVKSFPPLMESLTDLLSKSETFLGAYDCDTLVGCISLETSITFQVTHIASLTVEPTHQRKGVGRALLLHAINSCPDHVFTVTTAELNLPAMSLYLSEGFSPISLASAKGVVLSLVSLERHPHFALSAA